MTLLDALWQHTPRWKFVFPPARSLERALALAFGILCGVGKRTLTRAIRFQGHTQKDGSADDKVFSRSPWEPRALFPPILQHALQPPQRKRIVTSTDDTRVWRQGKHVPHTQWHYDPMGPPFQTNLRWGHRFLQASLVWPLYAQDQESSARSIPIRFEIAPGVKKPGKKASEAEFKESQRQRQEKNLSGQFVALTKELRQSLDQSGHKDKPLIQVADGSFCNRTIWKEDWGQQNVTGVTRGRKNIVLCRKARGPGRRFYGQTKFTPEQVRARFDGPVADAADFSRRLLSASAFQGVERPLLAGGSSQTPDASFGSSSHRLSHDPERADLLSAAGVSVDQRFDHACRVVAAGLLRPVGHRGQSSGRERNLGRGRGSSMEPAIGLQSAGVAGGHVERAVAGRTGMLRPATHRGL